MPELFVQQSRDISPDEFQIFLKALKDGQELNSLLICKRLEEKWTDFIKNPKVNPKDVEFPDSRCLPKGNPKGKVAGLYGIFTPECFYVGVSTCDIRGGFGHIWGLMWRRTIRILLKSSVMPKKSSSVTLLLLPKSKVKRIKLSWSCLNFTLRRYYAPDFSWTQR